MHQFVVLADQFGFPEQFFVSRLLGIVKNFIEQLVCLYRIPKLIDVFENEIGLDLPVRIGYVDECFKDWKRVVVFPKCNDIG